MSKPGPRKIPSILVLYSGSLVDFHELQCLFVQMLGTEENNPQEKGWTFQNLRLVIRRNFGREIPALQLTKHSFFFFFIELKDFWPTVIILLNGFYLSYDLRTWVWHRHNALLSDPPTLKSSKIAEESFQPFASEPEE